MEGDKKQSIIKQILENSAEMIFQSNGKPVYPSNSVWENLTKQLFNDHKIFISKKTLYNYVLLDKYRLNPKKHEVPCDRNSKELASDEEKNEAKNLSFKIVLSADEWSCIKPSNKMYGNNSKSYEVLKPLEWSQVFASHFWDMTKLPCAISFKRAQVSSNNTATGHYIKIEGSCKDCKSNLICTTSNVPDLDCRMIFDSIYTGDFRNVYHTRKRILSGSCRQEVVNKILTSHNLPNNFRNELAKDMMNPGEYEPANLPSAKVIRQAIYERKRKMRMDANECWSIFNLKFLHPYNMYIKDIGTDRFFLHYWSTLQMHIYNEYCKNPFSKIAIDATGGIAKKLKRPDDSSSGAIFLYDIAVRDPTTRKQYSVCNMLSERHDADSIAYWLNNWKRDGATTPTEIVCDMSLALLSGIAKSFGETYNITEYINNLYNLLMHKIPKKIPTFIRCDVAHVVKLLVQMKPLQNQRARTKQFYVRSLTKILLCSDMGDLENILFAIFVVCLSETDGMDKCGKATLCEQKKQFLKGLIADGSESTEEKVILENSGVDEGMSTTNVEFLELDDCDSKFKSWSLSILNRAKVAIGGEDDGDHDNMQYLPEIVQPIINLCKLLPLWTAVMTPILKNSGTVCSSASVESNFHNIKNRIFHNFQLPIRPDDMVKTHVESIEGIMRFASAKTLPENNFAEKSSAVLENSENKKLSVEEDLSLENWGGEGVIKKKRPRKSYLEPQKEWEFINLSDKTRIIPVAHLRNANASDLKPIKIGGDKYVITNTCAIDCLLQILSSAFCDSSAFRSAMTHWSETAEKKEENYLVSIIGKLITGKMSSNVYELRCRLMRELQKEECLPNGLKLISCVTTLPELLHNLMSNLLLPWCKTSRNFCKGCGYEEFIYTPILAVGCDFQKSLENSLSKRKLFCGSCKKRSKEMEYFINEFFLCMEWTDDRGADQCCKLSEIRSCISYDQKTYFLRGIIEIRGGSQESIGHFVAYAKRLRGKWEKYDDLTKKTERRINEDIKVSTTLMIYTC